VPKATECLSPLPIGIAALLIRLQREATFVHWPRQSSKHVADACLLSPSNVGFIRLVVRSISVFGWMWGAEECRLRVVCCKQFDPQIGFAGPRAIKTSSRLRPKKTRPLCRYLAIPWIVFTCMGFIEWRRSHSRLGEMSKLDVSRFRGRRQVPTRLWPQGIFSSVLVSPGLSANHQVTKQNEVSGTLTIFKDILKKVTIRGKQQRPLGAPVRSGLILEQIGHIVLTIP